MHRYYEGFLTDRDYGTDRDFKRHCRGPPVECPGARRRAAQLGPAVQDG